MDKTLYLIRGVSGSGKSSLARALSELPMCYEMCADYYFCEDLGSYCYDETSYKFNPDKLSAAHNWCQSNVEHFMRKPKTQNVVVHNTFTKEWEMKAYERLATKYNYRVVRLVVEKTHGNINLHDVPNHVLSRQEDNLRNSIQLNN